MICKAPLEYLDADVPMECALCHKTINSKTRCIKGHFVCDDCHRRGLDSIVGVCLNEKSRNPVEIVEKMMAMKFCHMHGPEHHVMVGAALLTAYKNSGGDIDLNKSLEEMMNRGKAVPGGICGFWGACGAAVSAGIFVSIISGSTPLTVEPFGLSNLMTSKILEKVGAVGGPRCCKRNSFLAIETAVDFVKEHFGIEMEKQAITCSHSPRNNQCIGKRCPFKKKHLRVVGAIIEYEGKILCMQRGVSKFPSTSYKYEFPGGKIEAGESRPQALMRELREEMDFDISISEDDYFGEVHHVYPEFEITMACYLCHSKTDVFNRKEHINHVWLKAEELGSLDWAAADFPIVEKLMQKGESI